MCSTKEAKAEHPHYIEVSRSIYPSLTFLTGVYEFDGFETLSTGQEMPVYANYGQMKFLICYKIANNRYYWRFTNARNKPRGVFAYFDTNESKTAPIMTQSETRGRCKRYYSGAWTGCSSNATVEIIHNKECYPDANPCDHVSNHCEYVQGQAKCSCPSGYTVKQNGLTCADIDECAFGARCVSGWNCVNTIGSYYCSGCVDNPEMLPMPVNIARSDIHSYAGENDVVLTCEQIQLVNFERTKDLRITDQHRIQRGLDGCSTLRFNRRDDRRLRKNIERGAATVYLRRWQLYPEGDPIATKSGKWLVPYLYDDDVPKDARIDIDHYLADFARQTCTKPKRITEDETFPKYRNHVRIIWINEGMCFSSFLALV